MYRVAKTHRIPYLCRSFSAKSYLYLVALLWKMICNLGDPMSLCHPVARYSISKVNVCTFDRERTCAHSSFQSSVDLENRI